MCASCVAFVRKLGMLSPTLRGVSSQSSQWRCPSVPLVSIRSLRPTRTKLASHMCVSGGACVRKVGMLSPTLRRVSSQFSSKWRCPSVPVVSLMSLRPTRTKLASHMCVPCGACVRKLGKKMGILSPTLRQLSSRLFSRRSPLVPAALSLIHI